ncbi:fibrobacter succinogenes major paralogous domain-containing protein [Fibrobacter sp.]|uniref:fibrobacter succinogenes major paralogous domain-containing protein n=1 Tax=Fibrobacter sp. TaxID=35828 RepID=UPI003866E035
MGRKNIAISCLMMLFLAACGENGDKSVSLDDEPVSAENSSSSSSVKSSSSNATSSSVMSAMPCKTDSADTCEYGSLTDQRDGRTYKIVKIGDQWWMAENLDYESADSYCYKDTASNCVKYGRLYTWAAAIDSVGLFGKNGKGCGDGIKCTPAEPVRGVCPSGWHLPSYGEWFALCSAVGDYPGRDLKSSTGWYGTDVYGFSVLPAGISFSEGSFGGEGSAAYFWSSTEAGSGFSYSMQLNSNDVRVFLDVEYKFERFSIRCVKD